MLEIKLERALEPEMMERQPCGMCGEEFQPEAVLIGVNIGGKYLDETVLCDVCLDHLARRAREEAIPAGWNDAYRRYVDAVAKYPEPKYPSVEALMEAEEKSAGDFDLSVYDQSLHL